MNSVKEDWESHINVIGHNIWYTGRITVIGVNDLIKEISNLIKTKNVNTKINLFISTEGGDVLSGLTLRYFLDCNYKDILIISTSKLFSIGSCLLFTRCDTFVHPFSNEFYIRR